MRCVRHQTIGGEKPPAGFVVWRARNPCKRSFTVAGEQDKPLLVLGLMSGTSVDAVDYLGRTFGVYDLLARHGDASDVLGRTLVATDVQARRLDAGDPMGIHTAGIRRLQ